MRSRFGSATILTSITTTASHRTWISWRDRRPKRKSSVSSSDAVRSSSQRTAKGGMISASLLWSPRTCRRFCAATTFRCSSLAQSWTEASSHGSAGAEPLNGQFKLAANGVTRFGLGQYPMKNAFISLPPLDTQRQIARFLDEKTARIDGLIEKKRALLDRLAEKRQALITRAVTKGLNPDAPMKPSGIDWIGNIPAHWELKRLKFGTARIGSGVTPRGGASVYVESGVMLLRSQNVHFEGLALDKHCFYR